MKITIEVIPHSKQRYNTCGDWFFKDQEKSELVIYVSSLADWRSEACIAIHELTEALLCKDRFISQKEVDIFDKEYEAKRKPGDTSEPGDCPTAPYYNEHFFATNIERQLALELGLEWKKYEEAINNL